MFKNVRVKKVLKRTIFPMLSFFNKIIWKRDDFVLLYSANKGISMNLIPLYDYLLENQYDRKYKIICGIEKISYATNENRVIFVDRFHSLLWFMRSRHVFYTTGQIPIMPAKDQIVIHLDHGATAFKSCGKWSKIDNGEENYFTLYTAPAEIYRPIVAKEFGCSESQIVINGEPMLDAFYQKTEIYKLGNYKRIGLWVPTFRQSDYFGYCDSSEGIIPMYNPEEYLDLNEILEKLDIKLLVKLHAGQNIENYIKLELSNFEVLSDKEFVDKGYDLYHLLKQVDFLIADYSSVFLQFLLLDKPIGFVVPDMEEYSHKRGFVFEEPTKFMPGNIVKSKADFYRFLNDMAIGSDCYKKNRHEVCDIVHTYKDGNNTKRALELSGITLDKK